MSQSPFQKFVPKKKNSVVKEEFRQEKKQYRKERNAFFEEKKKEEYLARQAKKGGMATKAADNAKARPAAAEPAIDKPRGAAKTPHQKSAKATAANDNAPTGVMPLNKYMAHCGVCSRRDAVELISTGKVKVNGKVATEPGYKVQQTD